MYYLNAVLNCCMGTDELLLNQTCFLATYLTSANTEQKALTNCLKDPNSVWEHILGFWKKLKTLNGDSVPKKKTKKLQSSGLQLS